jgi:hypothetical protein
MPPPCSGAISLRGSDAGSSESSTAGLAATFLDGALMSDGIYTPEPSELQLLVERTHAGGRALRRR